VDFRELGNGDMNCMELALIKSEGRLFLDQLGNTQVFKENL